MTATNKKLMGNHALASAMSKLRNEMIPSFFIVKTHKTQTNDWMHKSRKFMEKLRPETTNCASLGVSLRRSSEKIETHTLLTTVITTDARQ
jgi:hypothetical protein